MIPGIKSPGVCATCKTSGEPAIHYVIHAKSAAELSAVMVQLGFRGLSTENFRAADVFISTATTDTQAPAPAKPAPAKPAPAKTPAKKGGRC